MAGVDNGREHGGGGKNKSRLRGALQTSASSVHARSASTLRGRRGIDDLYYLVLLRVKATQRLRLLCQYVGIGIGVCVCVEHAAKSKSYLRGWSGLRGARTDSPR